MYDFQIIVPCIKERLEIFQKFGLSNIKDTKILVCCLVSDKTEFTEGWPEGVDVEFFETNRVDGEQNSDNPIKKLYSFLSNLTIEQCRRAKWTLKIDDDCYNDLYNMKEYLEKYYDYQKDFYLVGEIRHENDHVEVEILKEMNLWTDNYELSGWQHEFEGCIISSSAMEKIISNNKCKQLFQKRSKMEAGFTDQCLGLAASFCKIYPTLTSLMLTCAYDDDLKYLAVPFEEKHDINVVLNKKIHFVHFHSFTSERHIDLLELIEIENSIKQIKQKYEYLKNKNV